MGRMSQNFIVVKSAKIVAPPTTANTLRRESRAASRCRPFPQAMPALQRLIIFLLYLPVTANTTKAMSVVARSQSAIIVRREPISSQGSAPRQIKPGLRQLVVPSACAGGLRSVVGSSRICNRIATNNRRHCNEIISRRRLRRQCVRYCFPGKPILLVRSHAVESILAPQH
jgi:hypothetical protein